MLKKLIMSQRLGMADGRCFTINTGSRLINDYIMTQNGIPYQDNYRYRLYLQKMGPAAIAPITNRQQVGPPNPSTNCINQCQSCNVPLLKVPNTY
jgi:hypothetical protein